MINCQDERTRPRTLTNRQIVRSGRATVTVYLSDVEASALLRRIMDNTSTVLKCVWSRQDGNAFRLRAQQSHDTRDVMVVCTHRTSRFDLGSLRVISEERLHALGLDRYDPTIFVLDRTRLAHPDETIHELRRRLAYLGFLPQLPLSDAERAVSVLDCGGRSDLLVSA